MKVGTLGPLSDRRFAGGLLGGLAIGLGIGHVLGAEHTFGLRPGALTIGCVFVMTGAFAWAQQGWSAGGTSSPSEADKHAEPVAAADPSPKAGSGC